MWKLRKRPWYAHIFSEKRDFAYVTTTCPLSSKWAEHFLSIKMCTKLSFFDHFFVFAPEISFIQRFWPFFLFFSLWPFAFSKSIFSTFSIQRLHSIKLQKNMFHHLVDQCTYSRLKSTRYWFARKATFLLGR